MNDHTIKPKRQINPQWNNLFLRIQSTAKQKEGISFMHILVMVQNGIPFFWLPPEIIPLEPKLGVSVDMLMNEMTEKELAYTLKAVFKKIMS